MPPAPPTCELRLFRRAETAWSQVVRPWLTAPPGQLTRRYVVVPTRGQSHALKQRCLVEGVPLLGVEFLTPGLARQKWLALARPDPPALGRELLLLGLRILVEARLAVLRPEEAAWGFWKSLQSDLARALDEFEALLQAGFGAEHFPVPQLREIFTALTAWTESLGFGLASRQSEAAALAPVAPAAPCAGDALLIYGLSAEMWEEFFPVAAFARRGGDLTVVLPEPELRGARALDEGWIELWEALLGVEAQTLDASEPASRGEVAALWTGDEGGSAENARVLVGRTRADEMALLADELARLLAAGAENIAVIFPRADAAHLRLARLLAARRLPFADLLAGAGPPAVDGQLQRALLAFYARGARLEELLELWPRLRALNFVQQPLRAVRPVCERLFDDLQTHALAAYPEKLAAGEGPAWREVARVAGLLLPPWPEELTLADALGRFETVGARFNLPLPPGWPALAAFAARETRLLPARVVLATLDAFLPAAGPVVAAPGREGFAPVTLTTRRRAAGVAWSHVVFAESNAGVWPERMESSCWLPDDQRRVLNETRRFSLGLFTDDDRAALARTALAAIAGDTREQVIFTAALFEEDEPELRLAPNAWLERVLIAQNRPGSGSGGLEEVFSSLARTAPAGSAAGPAPKIEAWETIWHQRRDPAMPFNDYFLSGPPAVTRPARLAARLIERGVQDPAGLWFEAVLGIRRVDWNPLMRARKKSLGQFAHRLLAQTLSGPPVEGVFMRQPAPAEARSRLTGILAVLRAQWPRDRYWDSFHAELGELAGRLLEKVFGLEAGPLVAIEMPLPREATVPCGGGERLAVQGRMDLVLLDRPGWAGAQVAIVDFKTGEDPGLSATRMARGASLQLGIYLAAVESLGVAGGRVWMLKPEANGDTSLGLEELPSALAALEQIGRHLTTGCYGALTPDRTEYTHGFDWPLACTPVRHAVLAQKFARTFGRAGPAFSEETADE
ncbi:MAG: PD-(D/E)XK nuclease family protein [Opitutaceae bacterium]|nr:PD-(D/E)XK nuclease family protein [Opitutaceae bacterium]